MWGTWTCTVWRCVRRRAAAAAAGSSAEEATGSGEDGVEGDVGASDLMDLDQNMDYPQLLSGGEVLTRVVCDV
jgi:hypothetical protein